MGILRNAISEIFRSYFAVLGLQCQGKPGVYSTIWCLWYKTNKLKKKWKGERQAELNRPEKEAASGLGSCGVASGFAGGSSGRQPVTGALMQPRRPGIVEFDGIFV